MIRKNCAVMMVVDLAVTLASNLAMAQAKDDVRLGDQGQVAISGDLRFGLTYTDVDSGGGNSTQFVIAPAADFFVADNVSVGGIVTVSYANIDIQGGDANVVGIGVGPRVGYVFRLSDQVAFWPKAGFAFDYATSFQDGTDVDFAKLNLNLFAPFVFEPASNFFIGVGPTVGYDVWSEVSGGGSSVDGPKVLTVGFATQVGGFF